MRLNPEQRASRATVIAEWVACYEIPGVPTKWGRFPAALPDSRVGLNNRTNRLVDEGELPSRRASAGIGR